MVLRYPDLPASTFVSTMQGPCCQRSLFRQVVHMSSGASKYANPPMKKNGAA